MSRIGHSSLFSSWQAPTLSAAQLGVDSLQFSFSSQATDSVNLLAMTAGGLSSRVARAACLSALQALPAFLRFSFTSLFSLSVEVAAFRGVNHSLRPSEENYWSAQGFAREMINFGCLKGVGHFVQATNPLSAHMLQNLGMMLGEEAGARLHLTPETQGSFAERFVHASVTNFALGVGTLLSGVFTGHRIAQVERALENSARPVGLVRQVRQAQNILEMSANRPLAPRVLKFKVDADELRRVRQEFRDIRRMMNMTPFVEHKLSLFMGRYVVMWKEAPRKKGWTEESFWQRVGRQESADLREDIQNYDDGRSRFSLHLDPNFRDFLACLPANNTETDAWWSYLVSSFDRSCALVNYEILRERISKAVLPDLLSLAKKIRERLSTWFTNLEWRAACNFYAQLLSRIERQDEERDRALESFSLFSRRRREALIVLNPLLRDRTKPLPREITLTLEGTLNTLEARDAWINADDDIKRYQIIFVNEMLSREVGSPEVYLAIADRYLESPSSTWISLEGAEILARILKRYSQENLPGRDKLLNSSGAYGYGTYDSYLLRLTARVKGESKDLLRYLGIVVQFKDLTNNFTLPATEAALEAARRLIQEDPEEQANKAKSGLVEEMFVRSYLESMCGWVHCLRVYCALRSAVPDFKREWPEDYLDVINGGDATDILLQGPEPFSLNRQLYRELQEQAQSRKMDPADLLAEAIAAIGVLRKPRELFEPFQDLSDEQVEAVLAYLRANSAGVNLSGFSGATFREVGIRTMMGVFQAPFGAMTPLVDPAETLRILIEDGERMSGSESFAERLLQDEAQGLAISAGMTFASFLTGARIRTLERNLPELETRASTPEQGVQGIVPEVLQDVREGGQVSREAIVAALTGSRVLQVSQAGAIVEGIANAPLPITREALEAYGRASADQNPINGPALLTDFGPGTGTIGIRAYRAIVLREMQAAQMILEEALAIEAAFPPDRGELARVLAAQAMLRGNATAEQIALLESDDWGRRFLALFRGNTPPGDGNEGEQ